MTHATGVKDWPAYNASLRKATKQLRPELLKGFGALSNAAGSTTHLDAKTRELIALAVAITTRCEGCIDAHVPRALAAGATSEEIAEAMGVAIALNAGAALTYAGHVMDRVSAQDP